MARNKPTRPGRRVQLHRALSKLGLASRGEAWAMIVAGRVRVAGRVVREPLTWIDLDAAKVSVDHAELARPDARTIALHKPAGVVTTRKDERGRRTVFDLLPASLGYLIAVGRLDADSEGLLILTTDGTLSDRLTSPGHGVGKTYRVTVEGVPEEAALQALRDGPTLDDGPTRACEVCVVATGRDHAVLDVVLREGRNRQLRRMCAAVGHPVTRLVRIAVGGVTLGDMAAGEWRQLDAAEAAALG